jgi:hypothetical protein
MPSNGPKASTQDIMAKYGVLADEIWAVRPGTYAIKHSALERVAAELGIKFDPPQFAEKDAANKIVAMLVVGHLGERTEWSIGEASPANNKNAYCYAMAEKRGKDRVILKLLNAHGAYSDEEADDFKRANPHVTRAKDLVPEVEYDEHGVPVDNIPLGDERIKRLPNAHAKGPYAKLNNEMLKTKTPAELKKWGEKNADEIASLPAEWEAILRGEYITHRDHLRSQMEAAE